MQGWWAWVVGQGAVEIHLTEWVRFEQGPNGVRESGI